MAVVELSVKSHNIPLQQKELAQFSGNINVEVDVFSAL